MIATAEIVDDGGKALAEFAKQLTKKVAAAMSSAADDSAQVIQEQGRQDIAGAGNFGSRWTDGFQVALEDDHEGDITITATMGVQYWKTFQYGATIKGNPLLWIPFDKESAGNTDAFFTVRNRRGLLLLGSQETKQMLRFAKESVTIPKKFHLIEIAEAEAGKIGEMLAHNLSEDL